MDFNLQKKLGIISALMICAVAFQNCSVVKSALFVAAPEKAYARAVGAQPGADTGGPHEHEGDETGSQGSDPDIGTVRGDYTYFPGNQWVPNEKLVDIGYGEEYARAREAVPAARARAAAGKRLNECARALLGRISRNESKSLLEKLMSWIAPTAQAEECPCKFKPAAPVCMQTWYPDPPKTVLTPAQKDYIWDVVVRSFRASCGREPDRYHDARALTGASLWLADCNDYRRLWMYFRDHNSCNW